MKRLLLLLALLVIDFPAMAQDDDANNRKQVLQALANSQHRNNFAVTAVRLRTNTNVDRAYRNLDTMLSKEYGDMFWMYGMAGLYHSTKDILPDTIKQKMRNAWKHLTPYRGDTENHFLMYYSSLFLMSEVWPDLEGSEWFTGQSSKEINRESREYLLHWIDQVSKSGLNEFDSPRYQYYFFTPVILLSQYAEDAKIRTKSQLLLELMLADYAVKYVDGNYVGAHSRTFEAAALDARLGETSAYGQYFFEDSVMNMQPDLGFVALTDYACPEIIRKIAKEKAFPYELFESKRQRASIRYSSSEEPVAKYTYVDSLYSLGSLAGGIVQPIQQQSWKLVFHNSPSPNTITGLHPYRSGYELAKYFPEEPIFQEERIEDTKAGYSSENKWIGGSPYQVIAQNQNQIRVEYDLPPNIEGQHADLFIPLAAGYKNFLGEARFGDTIGANSFVRAEIAGLSLGFYFLRSPFLMIHEEKGTRFRSLEPACGYVLTAWINRFPKLIRSAEEINGPRRKEARTTLYRSPYINAKRGSGIITLSHGDQKRVLNFVTDRVQER
jgi:hypothetical protein